jgi:hypothetical protein
MVVLFFIMRLKNALNTFNDTMYLRSKAGLMSSQLFDICTNSWAISHRAFVAATDASRWPSMGVNTWKQGYCMVPFCPLPRPKYSFKGIRN